MFDGSGQNLDFEFSFEFKRLDFELKIEIKLQNIFENVKMLKMFLKMLKCWIEQFSGIIFDVAGQNLDFEFSVELKIEFKTRKTKNFAQGTWCSGITSASHAEGPGFNPQCVQLWFPSSRAYPLCGRGLGGICAIMLIYIYIYIYIYTEYVYFLKMHMS